MRNSLDPSLHRQREKVFLDHVESLLADDRFRVDTLLGRKPVKTLAPRLDRTDKGVELKRLMAELDRPDRQLESQMPRDESMTITLTQRALFFFRRTVGRVHVFCLSPQRELLSEQAPAPLDAAAVRQALSQAPPALRGAPVTVILLSTSGFTASARELAQRSAERTVCLVEPNDSGGWAVYGPPETQDINDLLDPEAADAKRQRVREAIADVRADLMTGGVSTERLAGKTQLPLQLVESELKSYAKQTPGFAAKRLDGRLVLFQQGAGVGQSTGVGGDAMPFLEKMKNLFSGKGENEKKVAMLSERRAALSQQRDKAYEDMSSLESKEDELKEQFKSAGSAMTKRRVTSQMLQLRKDIERRHQLINMLNQQVNVVSTALHNLELVQQGKSAKLPTSEELTEDAVAAEEMLAELEADSEMAASVSAVSGGVSMSDEEQALFDELEAESGGAEASTNKIELEAVRQNAPAQPVQQPPVRASQSTPPPLRTEPHRVDPEAG